MAEFIGRLKSGEEIRVEIACPGRYRLVIGSGERQVFDEYQKARKEGEIRMLESFFPEARRSEIKYLLASPMDEWEQLILKFR
ncbi:hypothetical protein [Halarsenatibacter silvermanii]|uniref:Uncharacterized protein n=1 Tax=Halarsenatibacter silvermanii TaxID=321763 RepID=A0A1G9L0T3_9FIRM|nr:hypothetical protein [Halarsenatibacter silvermanii]SDL55373.1 hypothetical protein SAMN04488692_105147 [Halarsenatibacter silvermanii]